MVGRGEERLGGGSMGWRVRADEEGEIEVREGGVGRASATICAGCSGRCKSLWRQLSAAGPSGGKFWPLQVSLAAIGCCRAVWRQLAAAGPLQGRCTRPSFNGAAVLEHSLCYFQVMLLLF